MTVKNLKIGREYYGPITAFVDDKSRRVRLVLKRFGRGSQQLTTGEIEKVIAWAVRETQEKHPGFEVIADGSLSVS